MSEVTHIHDSLSPRHDNVFLRLQQVVSVYLRNFLVDAEDKPDRVLGIIAQPSLLVGPNTNSELVTTQEEPFPSATTAEYLADSEPLPIFGNPEIAMAVRNNIVASEVAREETYTRLTPRFDMSTDDFKQRLQSVVESAVSRSGIYRSISLAELQAVLLGDGRFKSQIETGTTSSGTFDPERRIDVERKMFGIGPDYPAELRPIYGYLSDGEHGEVNEFSEPGEKNRLAVYGGIIIEFDTDKVASHTTVCFDDSLQYEDAVPPSPYLKPHFVSLPLSSAYRRLLTQPPESFHTSIQDNSLVVNYAEAQIHGGVNRDHIKAIHISPKNLPSGADIEDVREIFGQFRVNNPDSPIILVEF